MRAPWLWIFEKKLTHSLKQEPHLSTLLNHKLLRLHVQDTSLSLFCAVTEGVVSLHHTSPSETKPSATLSGRLVNLLTLLRNPHKRTSGVHLEGELGVLESFSQLMALARSDWALLLSPYLGDVFTYQAAKTTQAFCQYAKERTNHLQHDLRDYLTEELRILPTEPEVSHFIQAVDTLHLKTERLLARIARLKAKQ